MIWSPGAQQRHPDWTMSTARMHPHWDHASRFLAFLMRHRASRAPRLTLRLLRWFHQPLERTNQHPATPPRPPSCALYGKPAWSAVLLQLLVESICRHRLRWHPLLVRQAAWSGPLLAQVSRLVHPTAQALAVLADPCRRHSRWTKAVPRLLECYRLIPTSPSPASGRRTPCEKRPPGRHPTGATAVRCADPSPCSRCREGALSRGRRRPQARCYPHCASRSAPHAQVTGIVVGCDYAETTGSCRLAPVSEDPAVARRRPHATGSCRAAAAADRPSPSLFCPSCPSLPSSHHTNSSARSHHVPSREHGRRRSPSGGRQFAHTHPRPHAPAGRTDPLTRTYYCMVDLRVLRIPHSNSTI